MYFVSGQSPLSGLFSTPRFLDLSQSLSADGKTLVGGNVRDMIEMGFWTIRFLEGFENRYEKSGRVDDGVDRTDKEDDPSGRVEGDGKIWSSNARAFLKLMRYVTKFLSTFDKFHKNNS